jgi:hypothetical protein
MPTYRGTVNQLLQTDASGNVTWINEDTLGTDNQTLTYNSLTGQLNIANGNSVSLNIGDIADVNAGDGLVGGGTTGTATLDVVAINGLTTNADNIVLGGTLTQTTTLTQGTYNLMFNLNSTGDFKIQDNGVDHFEVRSTGDTYFGSDTFWNDGNTNGTTLARLYDTGSGDDGAFQIYRDGSVQHSINSSATTVFNEQGQNVDFRIEGDTDNKLFVVDASTNRIGVGTLSPTTSLHVVHPTGISNGFSISNITDSDKWHLYTFTSNSLSLFFNNSLVGGFDPVSGTYTAVSDRNLKKNIHPILSVLDKVNKLEIVDYNFINQKDSKKHIGFIAQDVEVLFPELVNKPSIIKGEEKPYTLDYSGFGTIAIKAIQEQQKVIETLKSENTQLKEYLKKIEERLTIIESQQNKI